VFEEVSNDAASAAVFQQVEDLALGETRTVRTGRFSRVLQFCRSLVFGVLVQRTLPILPYFAPHANITPARLTMEVVER
jgi:hypothetical protein